MSSPREAPSRHPDLRLAGIHLRAGSYALARVELEELAGADGLDADGVLDLAEVRWRTGDLAGAAAAAAAWWDEADGATGPGAVLANVIMAEGAAERGDRDAVAAHVAAAGPAIVDEGALERLLAGIPPRAPWVLADPSGPSGAEAPSGAAAPSGAGAPSGAEAPSGAAAPPRRPAPLAPAAASLVASGSALLAEQPERAAILLALALRADRAAAEAVLDALDAATAAEPTPTPATAGEGSTPGPGQVGLAFVRGEALRAAGRPEEARIAYASAERLALAPAEAGPSGSPQ